MKKVWALLLFACIIIALAMYVALEKRPPQFSSDNYDSRTVITKGNSSFLYLKAEHWGNEDGVRAVLNAVDLFEKGNPELCVKSWQYEVKGTFDDKHVYYGIWIYHRPMPPGGC